jgi:uncharacterized protein (TIGR02246 family)
MRTFVLICTIAAASFAATAPANDERAVRDLIERRNTAYHNLDAKTLTALSTPDFRLVDRFGDNIESEGPDYTLRMWSWTFREVYKERHPPEHTITDVRMLSPDVAVVQSKTQWPEITLDDGTKIPPHGEVDTFVTVKRNGEWRISVQTIHNQFVTRMGDHPEFRGPVPPVHN